MNTFKNKIEAENSEVLTKPDGASVEELKLLLERRSDELNTVKNALGIVVRLSDEKNFPSYAVEAIKDVALAALRLAEIVVVGKSDKEDKL